MSPAQPDASTQPEVLDTEFCGMISRRQAAESTRGAACAAEWADSELEGGR
jgi:hypothetical protein